MSDNSDLLGATPSAAPAADKPKRGRPRKVPEALQTAEPQPAPALSPELAALAGTLVAPQTGGAGDPDAVVPVGTTDIAALIPQTGTEGDPGPQLVSTPEADGSVSVELPSVSPEYAAAIANRVQIVDQPKREYAWQRLKRAGKKL